MIALATMVLVIAIAAAIAPGASHAPGAPWPVRFRAIIVALPIVAGSCPLDYLERGAGVAVRRRWCLIPKFVRGKSSNLVDAHAKTTRKAVGAPSRGQSNRKQLRPRQCRQRGKASTIFSLPPTDWPPALPAGGICLLEHDPKCDPQKWLPISRKDHAQTTG